jgi:hypothetical protein
LNELKFDEETISGEDERGYKKTHRLKANEYIIGFHVSK